MPKPSTKPDWTDGSLTKVEEPSSGKKLLGWQLSERPSFKFMNWLFYNVDQWIDYFEEVTDTYASVYQAVVSPGGLTLQQAHDLAAVVSGSRIYVKAGTYTVNAQINFSKSGIRVDCAPGASFVKGSASTGLRITGDDNVFDGLRFSSFSGGGDQAIEVAAGGDRNRILNTNFASCTTEINDLASGTVEIGSITE
jgi:hypothetical protein